MVIFKFLGTSAGEQYPGFWCHCPNCEESRTLSGKNVRKNSSAYIMNDCLIDLPAEIFMQAERHNVDLTKTKYLLVTHSDKDHLYPYLLRWRYMKLGTRYPSSLDMTGPRFSEIEKLIICGNRVVCDLISKELGVNKEKSDDYMIELLPVEPFEDVKLGDLSVKTLRTNHGSGEDALNFIIQVKGRTILYGLDTGWFLPKTYDVRKEFTYDLVVLEATFGDGRASDGHFNFDLLRKAHDLFKKDRLMRRNDIFCATHFCPHFSPVHDLIAPKLAREGILAAYDGMELEL
ncbi:MAG: MBL fold metallo-hydrolase [Thermoproteota archaeon]